MNRPRLNIGLKTKKENLYGGHKTGKFYVLGVSKTGLRGSNKRSGPYDTYNEAESAQRKWFLGAAIDSQIVQTESSVIHYDKSKYLTDVRDRLNVFISNPTISHWRDVVRLIRFSSSMGKLYQCPEISKSHGVNCAKCSYNIRNSGILTDVLDFSIVCSLYGLKQAFIDLPSASSHSIYYPYGSCLIYFMASIPHPLLKRNLGPLVKFCLSLSAVISAPPKNSEES